MESGKIKLAVDTTFMDRRGAKGTAVFIREFVEELKHHKSEFDITLIHHEPIPEDPIYKEFEEIIIPQIKLPRGGRVLSELMFFLTAKKRFDAYYFAYSNLSRFFFLAPAKIKLSMQYDGGPDTAGVGLPATKGKIKRWMLPFMRLWVDAFIATSNFGKKGLVEKNGFPEKKVFVAYGGATNAMFRAIPKEEARDYIAKEYDQSPRPFIIASGRLDPHKNILRLVEAYDILKKKYDFTGRLIVTGGIHMPDYSEQVLALIKERGLEADVEILYVRKFDEMPYFYSAAEVMVFPSLYEGFGLPLAEAMQCGVPTLASRGSSLIEVGGDATVFFDPLDPEDMAEKLHATLQNDTLKRELIERGFKQVQRFTWKNHTESILNLIKELHGKTV